MFRIKHNYEDMENSSNYSAEEMAYSTMLGNQESGSDTQFFEDPGPDDEDEEESEEEEAQQEGEEAQEAESSGDDNPPLDDDIVHSPVPTKTGGRPKSDS